jgi:outer membrane protein insertion porin family
MQILRAFGLVVFSLIFAASQLEAKTDEKTEVTAPKTETVKVQQLVEEVDFQGNRRLRDEDLLYYIKTRPGDVFSAQQLELDLRALNSLDFFDKTETRVLTEEAPRGGVRVIFEVRELPVIRDLQFRGLKAVPESDVLKAFREQRVRISRESTFNPVNAQRGIRVIRELLASKGYPNATVTVDTEEVSATSTAVTFNVDQGNRSRIVEIVFEGNEVFRDSELRSQLQLVRETGLISRFKGQDILDLRKLEYDLQRNVREYMFSKGYFQARIGDPQVEGLGYQRTAFVSFLPLPLISSKDDTLRIIVPIVEGRIYRVGDVTIEGNSIFTEQQILDAAGLRKGEIVNGGRLRATLYEDKGSFSLKRAYGSQGFIEYDAELEPEFKDNPNNPKEGIVDLKITIDEGKQYRLHRLEFTGNTFTRDRILRREVLINEGDIYNQSYLEISIARLNQTQFFDPIDKDRDVTIRTDEENGDVDLVVAVKEKGRQQISFNGAVSGVGGTSFGLQYSTNNLLGRGEVLSLSAGIGNRMRNFEFGYQMPYFRNRPIQVGFSLYLQKYKYLGEGIGLTDDQSIIDNLIGANLGTTEIEAGNLFTQSTYGASVFATAPLSELLFRKRKFTQFSRLGLTYQFSTTSIEDPPNRNIPIVFATQGITTSRVTPSFVYDTRQPAANGIDTLRGSQLAVSTGFAGLGGDVRTYSPSISYSRFIPVRRTRSQNAEVFAFRILAGSIGAFSISDKIRNSNSLSYINGIPYYERFLLGTENDVRGYTNRSIGPIAPIEGFITTRNVVVATNPTGTPTLVEDLTDEQRNFLVQLGTFTGEGGANPILTSRTYQRIGGDTQLLGNFEYRIPIFGPVTLAAFLDVGSAFNLRKGSTQNIDSNFLPDQPFLGLSSIGNLVAAQGSPYAFPDLFGSSSFVLRNGEPTPLTVTQYTQEYCTTDPETEVITCPTTLPEGLRQVFLRGEAQTNTRIKVGDSIFSKLGDFRSSVGLELRVQVPVVNVPFRLIYYYNPNAKFGFVQEAPGIYLPGKRNGWRFTVGRTF